MSLLELKNVFSGYGAIEVLKGVSLFVMSRQIVSIIGSNGAGKSTLLRTVSGLVRPRNGEIIFDNQIISQSMPHKIVSLGLVQVPEGRQIFGPLTVHENLLLGCYVQRKSLGEAGINIRMDKVFGIFPILSERKNQVAGTLSGGEQQMLAIGRALMAQPKLLLLDEPSQGLAPLIVEEIGDVLREINKEGLSVLLVEQNASIALSITHYGYLLNMGIIALEGKAQELVDDPRVKEVYLGEIKIDAPS
jgi:branched-chain amino acid transport system ATP-binding protein